MTATEFYALMLTVFAGLATVPGSIFAMFTKKTNTKLLACSLGFSAGVMIYVSMAELMVKSNDYLLNYHGDFIGNVISVCSFFGGIILIALIDYFIPSAEGDIGNTGQTVSLKRMGILTTAAIAIHNFPEGLVTFASTLSDINLGIMIAVAIAIHNIPEGIATALPIYFATGNRKKSFIISFISGITEPIGAILGYTVMKPYLNDSIMGIMFAGVAGIMMFISLEELLPMAHEYEKSKITILSVISGMAIMAISLIMFI